MIVFQRRIANLLAAWIALALALSIAAAIDLRHGGDLYGRLALIPDRVWRGEVWRLATWVFVELGPWSLLFGCIAIYWAGGALLAAWGARRFVRAFIGIALFTGVATAILVSLAYRDAADLWYFGGAPIGDALLVAWGLTFPTARVRIWMIVVIEGRVLAYGLCVLATLYALFYGVPYALPHLLACGAAFAVASGALPRWRRKLRVVPGGKPTERPHGPYWVN
jgi:membrane associated rhomboid family serine protease